MIKNIPRHIRLLVFFISIVVIMLLLNACRSSQLSFIETTIDSISLRLIPDRREAICDIRVKGGDKGSFILTGETTIVQVKFDIIKTLDASGIVFIDSIIILPEASKNEKYLGLVSLSVINLRKEPDHRSELVSQSILGTPVLVLKEEDGWLLIQTPDKYIAWTEGTSIQMMTEGEIEAWKQSQRIIFMQNSGWIYRSYSGKSVMGDLVAGSILIKIGQLDDYLMVKLPDGREGFVKNESFEDFNQWEQSTSGTPDDICRTAESYMGLPYLWGGSSSKSVDCSGLVQSVYFLNGLILSRDASQQALHGKSIDISGGFSELKRGDLLFFGSKKNNIARVTHVAIYKGDSEYIHSSGRVMINSLDSSRVNYSSSRKNSLLEARRIIGVENDDRIVHLYEHPWY